MCKTFSQGLSEQKKNVSNISYIFYMHVMYFYTLFKMLSPLVKDFFLFALINSPQAR